MAEEWNEKTFHKWLDLRSEFKNSKKDKNWQNIINVCTEIIRFADQAKFICIMTPLFYKEMANAYYRIEDIDSSLKYYYLAKEGFVRYRNINALSNPNDWLRDINTIEKRIVKLLHIKNTAQ